MFHLILRENRLPATTKMIQDQKKVAESRSATLFNKLL